MDRFLRHIIIIFLIGLPLFHCIAKKSADKEFLTDNQRKAEYLFLEGQRMKALEKNDAYFDLLRYAYELDPSNSVIAYYLGYCYLTMENPTEEKISLALSLMQNHFDEKPDDYYESYFYGNINQKLGRNDEALRVWEKLSSIYPDKIELKYQLADNYAKSGNYSKAIEEYNSIEKTEGKSIPLTLRKLNFFLSQKDSINAINEGYNMLRSAPSNVQYNLFMGDLFQQLNKPDSAFLYYNKAQQIDPSNGYVYLSKASYYNAIGDTINYDKEIYEALINENLDIDSKLEVLSGYIQQKLQNNDLSEKIDTLFNVLIGQHPHEVSIHELYSKYLATKKDYKGAAEQLSYALDINPANADNWKKLMFIYFFGNNYNGAIEAAQKSLAYNPDNIELYQYIAPAYYQMKEYDKAIDVYHNALDKIDSLDVNLRSNILGGLADTYYMKGDTIEAFKTYELSLDINPGNTLVLNNYAYFLAENDKDLDKAEKMSALAVKGNPENATFLDTYAWIFFKKKEYKLARIYIESAFDNEDEPSAELYEHYGDILFMLGEPGKALEQWEKALELKPDSDILARKVKHKTYFYK